MANFNTYMFIADASQKVSEYRTSIEGSDSYEEGKNESRKMLGFLDGMITFLNTMVVSECSEGSTEELDELISRWESECYQSLVDLASNTHQAVETILKLCELRDQCK